MAKDNTNQHHRWRKPAALFGCVAVLLTGCGHSSKPKTYTPTALGCSWPAGVVLGRDAILVDTSNTITPSQYQLMSLATGELLAACGKYSELLSSQWPTTSGTDIASSKRLDSGVREDRNWYGAMRPGGPDGAVVVTKPLTPATSSTSVSWSKEAVILDMATKAKAKTNIPGFEPAQVARDQVIMVRTAAVGSSLFAPAHPGDWCLAPLGKIMASTTPSKSGQAIACKPVPGAKGAGTPVVLKDGTVAWIPLAMTRTTTPARETPNVEAGSYYWVRAGHGMIVEAGYAPVNGDHGTVIETLTSNGVSPNGVGFLPGWSYGPPAKQGLPTAQPFTWFTLGKDPTQLLKHFSPAGATELQTLTGQAIKGIWLTDSAISDDGKTLYTFWTDINCGKRWLIAIPDQGEPCLIIHYNSNTQQCSSTRPRFITVPNPNAGQDK